MKFSDFFKPRWKHSDPRIRAEAIREMESEEHSNSLKDIVLSDNSSDNRKNALKKISDEACLVEIVQRVSDRSLSETAQKKLNEHYSKKIKAVSSESEALQVLEKIKEQKALEDIILSTSFAKVKELAFSRLMGASSFYKIALEESNAEIALKALEKVDKPLHLETLAKKAKSKAVRVKAKERSLSNIAAPVLPSKEAMSQAKFELLCKSIEEHQVPKNWNTVEQKVLEIEEGWEHLVSLETPSSQIKERFEKARQEFWKVFREHQERHKIKEAQEKKLRDTVALRQELCHEFERLLTTKSTFERNQKIQELIEHWKSVPRVSAEEEETYEIQFKNLLASFHRQKENQDQVLTLEQNQSALLAQLQQFITSEFFDDRLESTLGQIKDEWASLPKDEGSANRQAEFQNLLHKAEQTIAHLHEKELQSEKAKVLALKAVNSKLSTLIDNPDLLKAEKTFKDLNQEWKKADEFSIYTSEIRSEVEPLRVEYYKLSDRFRETLEWYRWANLKKKQELCDALESAIKETSDPKELFIRWKEVQADWKSIGPVSWENTKETWDRYRKLTDEVYEKCQAYFGELDSERKSNLEQKQKLCELVQNLLSEDNWRESSEKVKEAQSQWKDIGPVPKESSEEIWERFKTLCDQFYQGRKGYYSQLENEKESNAQKKLALCELVEQHKDSDAWKETSEIFKKAQQDWKEIGPVPKDQIEPLWDRFRNACDSFFQRKEEFFGEMNQQKQENLAKKIALCEQIEKLHEIESDQDRFELIKKAQAEWKEIGPIPKEQIALLWDRFRKPIDSYFESRKGRMEEEAVKRDENLAKKQELVDQAEQLSQSSDWKKTSEQLKKLQGEWKEIGPAPRDKDRECWQKFRQACDTFFNRMKEHYKQLDDKRDLNLRNKLDLCYQSEVLAGFEIAEASKDAIPDWLERAEQVKELQKKWKLTGPVPKAKSDELWQRFRMACDYVLDYARAVSAGEEINLEKNLEARRVIADDAERVSNQVHTDAQIQKIKDLQRDWKMNGPIPHESFPELWIKFRSACDVVFSEDERLKD